MAIKPTCDVTECKKELVEFGAILFSPPDGNGMVRKQHVCVGCYDAIQSSLFCGKALNGSKLDTARAD